MKQHTDLLWLDTRLDKLKLWLEGLRSKLVDLDPRNEKLRLPSQDVECQTEFVRLWINDLKPGFRGLEPRFRGIRTICRKLLAFGLIALFIVSWWIFLRRGELVCRSRIPEPDTSVSNSTLGVCLPVVPYIRGF